ncbi:MAG: lactate racemase domain-containing protein [Planctomycetota bacterium]|nr:lactate racemase domain-containing protein [Planctomycetota bacterium]
MTLFHCEGSAETSISADGMRTALYQVFQTLGARDKVLAIPPDFTRFHSRAGALTSMTYEYYQDKLVDIMPALGTHVPMPSWQLDKMYKGVPHDLFREHRWRDDVLTIGQVPAAFVSQVTAGIWEKPWPAQMNKLVFEGGHDLILSIGQVVPHEVIGMANYNKNIFVGTGGVQGINESHFIGAAYGMERMMGRADTPLRKILNYAQDNFCQHLPLVYVLTVVGSDMDGNLVTRGLFIGDDVECFEKASELSAEVNFQQLDEEFDKVVVYLDPEEFHSTWLGNKAIYRTRMAIADGGELVVLAPKVKTFGEDAQIDALIRKYGYRTTPEIMKFMDDNEDLQNNLSAVAHLMHGSSENRFKITYCPGELTKEEIEGVGYAYGELDEMLERYKIDERQNGWHETDAGERFYYVSNPALGLWAHKSRI